jgi:hypothetical protein
MEHFEEREREGEVLSSVYETMQFSMGYSRPKMIMAETLRHRIQTAVQD